MKRTPWIGPLGLGPRDARWLDERLTAGAGSLGPTWRWIACGVVIGVVPFLAAWTAGLSLWALPTAVGLAGLLVLGAAGGRTNQAAMAVGLGMLAHSITAIGLTAWQPEATAMLLPGGEAYWEKTLRWVQTGESPEYTWQWWVPAHVQLVVATTLLSYASLGITTLYEGLYEVGLMNCYVGHLVREADRPLTALLVGWHPWSVARGLGFLAITAEVADLSLSRLLGRPCSPPSARRARWAWGLGFVCLDGLLKALFLEPVRVAIAGSLPAGY